MKYFITLVFSCWLLQSNAQPDLIFNKRFVECEDKWVAFTISKDSSYSYGFIYIDEYAGLTFNNEGSFRIGTDGKYVPKKMDNVSMKVRLEANNVKVALIPKERFNELEIQEVPGWLSIYKETKDSIKRMVRWGFLYNAWDESQRALPYLEKAYSYSPHFKGLEFELAYAYNALGRYAEAIPVLESAIANDPKECLFHKELSFALIYSDMPDKAAVASKKGIEVCTDKALKAEIAYNLTYTFYQKKDKEQFVKWAAETRKWTEKDSLMDRNIVSMEKAMGK